MTKADVAGGKSAVSFRTTAFGQLVTAAHERVDTRSACLARFVIDLLTCPGTHRTELANVQTDATSEPRTEISAIAEATEKVPGKFWLYVLCVLCGETVVPRLTKVV
jgi:hypothetical protein